MAVVENASVDLGINGVVTPSSSSSLTSRNSAPDSNGSSHYDLDQPKQNGRTTDVHPFHHQKMMVREPMLLKISQAHVNTNGGGGAINGNSSSSSSSSGFGGYTHHRSSSSDLQINGDNNNNNNNNNNTNNTTEAAALKRERDMRELEELLSKLNPMAEEFVPTYFTNNHYGSTPAFYPTNFLINTNAAAYDAFDISIPDANNNTNFRRKRNSFNHGKRRINSRTSMAQREEIIKRTVYVSDIDQQVTEEQLAALFINCGQVVDCRICGDPNSVLRFAFIEFTDEEGAKAALTLAGTMLGYYPVRVLPSKTAIAPVNPTFLPRSEDEREMCARTIYCTNIDKKVTQTEVKLFFEQICGPVYRLRLLGDYHHSTRIAFVEFVMAESAIAALNCSGVVLGASAIRISPSKTPVRPRAPRPQMH